jgi:hypothetical protein
MNERIQELARQAAGGMLSYDGEGEWRLSEKEAEKFAQLVWTEAYQAGFDAGRDWGRDSTENHPDFWR